MSTSFHSISKHCFVYSSKFLIIFPVRTNYHSEDRDWFLKLANAQQEWRASDQLLNEVVISSSYSGDLVSAMESSLKRTRYRPHIMADIPSGCVSMFVFKMYLSRILGVCEQQEQQTLSDEVSTQSTDLSYSGPLLMYQPDVSVGVALIHKMGVA